MIFVFYFFAAVLILLSFKSFRGGIRYLKFFQKEISNPRSDSPPFVSIIAPCRGIDPGFEENVQALFVQDYPAYEIVFVVDDKDDPAARFISDMLDGRAAEARSQEISDSNVNPASFLSPSLRIPSSNLASSKLIVAPKARISAQKIENLREAVLHVADESQALVFVDSDARPSVGWLRHIVAPLEDKDIGASTGYRWFISESPSLASELRSAWNASIASALGPNLNSNFCWGGSMAIRRDTFARIGMRGKWQGTLSDDFALTRALKAENLPIVFVPKALTASVENCSFGEMFEFTTRQMKITRVYASNLWVISMIGSALFNAVMIAALLISVLPHQNLPARIAAFSTFILVCIFSTGKAWFRLKAVRLVFSQYENELRKQAWPQYILWIVTPAIFFYNSVAAWSSRKMTWRGITYELKSPTETVIIAD